MTDEGRWPNVQLPIVLIAFSGWSDAADAATEALDHIALSSHARDVLEIDLEDFMDFQASRPHTVLDDSGVRHIEWPTIRVRHGRVGESDIVLIDADEPNLRWRTLASDLAAQVAALQPRAVVFLGALLADVPHSRPTPVTCTSVDPEVQARCDIAPSTYEGPTGIVGVLSVTCAELGLPVTSLWAAVPHYVAQSPCPPAVLGLLSAVEEVVSMSLPQGDYPDQSRAWVRRCDELAADDEDLRTYIEALQEQYDAEELPQTTGEAIAREFERYLRRRATED